MNLSLVQLTTHLSVCHQFTLSQILWITDRGALCQIKAMKETKEGTDLNGDFVIDKMNQNSVGNFFFSVFYVICEI